MNITRPFVAPRFCSFLAQDIAWAMGFTLGEYFVHILSGTRRQR